MAEASLRNFRENSFHQRRITPTWPGVGTRMCGTWAKVAISARDGEALRRAEADVRRFGKHVLAIETDITMREEAEMALDQKSPVTFVTSDRDCGYCALHQLE
jgi:hypothetical protein